MNGSDIVRRLMPRFHIHSEEAYNSMFIDNYRRYCTESADGTALTMTNESCRWGTPNDLQIFASIVELTDERGDAVTDIVYYLFFPFNGAVGLANQGEHWYDMEHVTLRFLGPRSFLNPLAVPERVMFSIHSKYRWFEWTSKDILKTDNKLHVFVARGSHACYPKPRTYCRYLGFANDHCDIGKVPEFVNIIMYDPHNKLFQYKSVCDGDPGRNFNRKELIYGEAPNISPYAGSITSYAFT